MLLIVTVIVCVLAGVYLGGYLAERRENPAKAKPDVTPTQPATGRRWWFGSAAKQPDRAAQFQNWASAHFQDPDLRNWIAGLSKEQCKALTEHLTSFCNSLGFELDWLTSQRLASTQELGPSAALIVEHYCTACFQATTVQSGFQHFKKALDLVEQPFSRDHKPTTQKVYAELVRRNAVPPMTPELMLASEQERQDEIARALKEVSRTNWATFIAAFEAVLLVEGAKPQARDGLVSSLRPSRLRQVMFPAARKSAPEAPLPPEAPSVATNEQTLSPS